MQIITLKAKTASLVLLISVLLNHTVSFAQNPNEEPQSSQDTVGEEPTGGDQSRLFLRDSEVLLKSQEVQFTFGLVYSKSDVVDRLRFARSRQITLQLGFSAGLSDRAEIFASLPIIYASLETLSLGGTDDSSATSIGDISVGISRKLIQESENLPSLTGSFSLVLPTGEDSNPLESEELSTGAGLIGISGGLSASRSLDPAVLFVNLGYETTVFETMVRIADNPDETIIKPGDAFNYGYGAGLSVNSAVSLSARVSGSYRLPTKVNGSTLPGSSVEPITLALGLIQSLGSRSRLEASVGFGLNDDASDVDFSFDYIWN